ncbi:MAG: glycosyltransferase family 2 protein [Candidatus Omnitrophica bacterium]|nr:glycosyltransferase family 2 protein [Candidatus Omnitrophota bacterium]
MDKNKLISIVLPIYNEEKVIRVLYHRIISAISGLAYDFELIFVNDASSDDTLATLLSLHRTDKRVKVISFSRNFGHQSALIAGIEHAKGDALILMDADLEDDPKEIPSFVKEWENGYDVVYARRSGREASWFRKMCFSLFHKLNYAISETKVDAAGIFSLMDKKVSGYLKKLPEKDKYLPGLRSWIGFRQIGIEIKRGKRYDSQPRVKVKHLFKLAFDSFTSFSTLPLQISIFFGLAFVILSFLAILSIAIAKLFYKFPVQGWASIVSIILLVGGIQLICIGLQGEYICRIFNEVKNRPNYIISSTTGFEENGREADN